jgi:hypothetical protein
VNRSFPNFLVLLLTVALTGCASRSMRIVARNNATETLAPAAKIALAAPRQSRPEDETLVRLLAEELQREGRRAESLAAAEFQMTGWMEDSWDELPSSDPGPRLEEHVSTYPAQPGRPGGARIVYEYAYVPPFPETRPKRYLSTKGIRLALYSNRTTGAAKLSAVWEGYLEIGTDGSSEHVALAVRKLLTYLGKDFIGHVRLEP